MNSSQIEYWTLNIIERICTGQPIEDSRVEVKAKWTNAIRAARRLAGHANAARGESILWLVGVDEKEKKVVGANKNELSDWFSQVSGQFDGLVPDLFHLSIPKNDVVIEALLFDTSRAPYVVKNPQYGQPGAGSANLEVPWREATKIRSATRSDLIKILVPTLQLPSVEVIEGEFSTRKLSDQSKKINLNAYIILYFLPKTNEKITIPFHHCQGFFQVKGELEKPCFSDIRLNPPKILAGSGDTRSLSKTVECTSTEAFINGAGKLIVYAKVTVPTKSYTRQSLARASFHLPPVNMDQAISFHVDLKPYQKAEEIGWKITRL